MRRLRAPPPSSHSDWDSAGVPTTTRFEAPRSSLKESSTAVSAWAGLEEKESGADGSSRLAPMASRRVVANFQCTTGKLAHPGVFSPADLFASSRSLRYRAVPATGLSAVDVPP